MELYVVLPYVRDSQISDFLWYGILYSCAWAYFVDSGLAWAHKGMYSNNLDGCALKRKGKRSGSVLWKKPLHPQKIQKASWQHTKAPPKTSITQQLRTDLGRSVWVIAVNPSWVGAKAVNQSWVLYDYKCIYPIWYLISASCTNSCVFWLLCCTCVNFVQPGPLLVPY